MRALFLPLLMFATLCTFGYGLALADDVAGGSPIVAGAPPMPSGWAGVVFLAIAVGAWALRRYSAVPFFHTQGGAMLFALLNSVATTLTQALVAHGLDLKALAAATGSAVLTLLVVNNPSNTADEQAAKIAMMKAPVSPPPPPITKVAAMLPLLFIVFAVSGCPSAGGKALVACELGKLPQTEQSVLTDVTAIAMAGGTNWQSQLEALGLQVGPGQLDCVIAAIVAAWSSSHGELTPERKAALERLQIYRNAHPSTSSCAPPPPSRACINAILTLG